MANLTFPFIFVPNTLIRSTQVNADFLAVKTLVETTGLDNANIAAAAAIARSKLAAGIANHVIINNSSGTMSSEATLAVSRGGTNASSWTAGSVVFAGAGGTSLTQDNANIFYDSTNARLGLGTTAPGLRLHVKNTASNLLARLESGQTTALLQFVDSATSNAPQLGSSGDSLVFKTGGSATTRLTVADALITSAVTLQASQAVITALSTAGPVITSAGGLLSSEAALNPARGGTGISSYTAGDVLYASAATVFTKLGIGAANTVLASTGTAPNWTSIVGANISASADIARSKLAAGTANSVLINDASGTMSSEATLAVSRGGTNASSWTAGSVIFAGAGGTSLAQDNSHLFWDDANNFLGIGTSAPAVDLHIKTASVGPVIIQSSNSASNIRFQDAATSNTPSIGCVGDDIRIKTGGSATTRLSVSDNGTSSFSTDVGIGVSPSFQMQLQNGNGSTYNGSSQSGFNRQLAMGTTQNATNRNSSIWLYQGGNNASVYLTGVQNAGGGGDFTVACTNTAGTIAEVTRWTSEGLVGIKTSTPTSTLHVVGSLLVTSSASFQSAVTVTGQATLGAVSGTAAATFASTLYVGSTATFAAGVSVTGNVTFNSDLTFGTTGSGPTIVGVTDGSNSTSSYVGYSTFAFVSAAGAVTITSGTNVTIASLLLTAGDWLIDCLGVNTGVTAGTVMTVAVATATNSLTGVSFGTNGTQSPTPATAAADAALVIPGYRVSITANTTYYFVMSTTHTVGTSKGYGRLSAHKIR